MFARSAFVLLVCTVVVAAPAPPPRATRTYRFEAKVLRSECPGIKVGDPVTGTFSYDLNSHPILCSRDFFLRLSSARNTIQFEVAGYRFEAVNDVRINLVSFNHIEGIGIVSQKTSPVSGWAVRPSCSLGFERAPVGGKKRGLAIPDRIFLKDYTSSPELSIFVDHDTLVRASIEKLEEVRWPR